jgi:hypothetical protein
MDSNVVETYLARLQAALGKEDVFPSVIKQMVEDVAVKQPEAVEIASRFVARMSASTAKKKAIERIADRHQSLVTFKLKQRAVGGRSAA